MDLVSGRWPSWLGSLLRNVKQEEEDEKLPQHALGIIVESRYISHSFKWFINIE